MQRPAGFLSTPAGFLSTPAGLLTMGILSYSYRILTAWPLNEWSLKCLMMSLLMAHGDMRRMYLACENVFDHGILMSHVNACVKWEWMFLIWFLLWLSSFLSLFYDVYAIQAMCSDSPSHGIMVSMQAGEWLILAWLTAWLAYVWRLRHDVVASRCSWHDLELESESRAWERSFMCFDPSRCLLVSHLHWMLFFSSICAWLDEILAIPFDVTCMANAVVSFVVQEIFGSWGDPGQKPNA